MSSPEVVRPRFAVGDQVFIVITPKTPRLYCDYRPKYPYFVLQTTVDAVDPEPRCRAYLLDTRYTVSLARVFTTHGEAEAAMPRYYEADMNEAFPVGAVVPLVSKDEEAENEAAVFADIHERLQRSSPATGYD